MVKYLNSTGYGLDGATILVIDVTPSLGLVNYTPVDEGGGNYSIKLWPNATTTFTIQIRTNLTTHQTKYLTFTLTGLQVLTTLTLNTTVKTIGVTDSYTVRITYIDDNNKGIENATIMVYDPSLDLDFSEIIEIGDGNYTLAINPLDFGTFLVKINASKQYYQSGYTSFTLIANPVEMDLIVLNGTADSAKCLEDYRLVIRYQKHGTSEGVAGATVEIVSITPSTGLINQTPVVDEEDGNYSIIFRPNTTETFTISIRVFSSKTGLL